MEIREGTQRIENGTKQAIIEFVFTDYIIFVFQGTLSQFDIGQPIKFCVNNNPSSNNRIQDCRCNQAF